jgi:hypothetical protein
MLLPGESPLWAASGVRQAMCPLRKRTSTRTRRRLPGKPRFARATGAGDGAREPSLLPQPLESEGIGGYGVGD